MKSDHDTRYIHFIELILAIMEEAVSCLIFSVSLIGQSSIIDLDYARAILDFNLFIVYLFIQIVFKYFTQGHMRIPFKRTTHTNGVLKNDGVLIIHNSTAHVFAGITLKTAMSQRKPEETVTIELISRDMMGIMRVLYREDVELRRHRDSNSYQTIYILENFKVSRDTDLFLEISDSSKIYKYNFTTWINVVVS